MGKGYTRSESRHKRGRRLRGPGLHRHTWVGTACRLDGPGAAAVRRAHGRPKTGSQRGSHAFLHRRAYAHRLGRCLRRYRPRERPGPNREPRRGGLLPRRCRRFRDLARPSWSLQGRGDLRLQYPRPDHDRGLRRGSSRSASSLLRASPPTPGSSTMSPCRISRPLGSRALATHT